MQHPGNTSDYRASNEMILHSRSSSEFAHIPSGPRNQAAPTGPSGRNRSRFDKGVVQNYRENDSMDVDPLPLPRPPLSRVASVGNPDRAGGSAGVPPTGPRAHAKVPGQPVSGTPPTTSPSMVGSSMRLPPQETGWQRAPPPHLRQDTPSAPPPPRDQALSRSMIVDLVRDRLLS